MAEAIVGPLLSKLQDVAVQEGKRLAEVGGEIDKLRDKLMWLQALVYETDLSSRSDGSRLVRVLACQIREVAFEAEDAVDEFYLQADLFRRFGRNWWRAALDLVLNFRTHVGVRFVLSRRIQSMNARLEEIVGNSSKYSIGQKKGQGGNSWRPSRAIPPIREDWEHSVPFELICRRTEKNVLMGKLKDISCSKVIHVVGVGGVGKRALLRDALDEPSVKGHFHVCIRASFSPGISDTSMVQQITKKLLEECYLRKKPVDLEQVRYLVVIESQINPTTCRKLETDLLEKAGQGSKILLAETSKHEEMDSNNSSITLGNLLAKDSETLFNYAMGTRGKRASKFKTAAKDKIRDNIEQITNGLPLAVVLLAKFMTTMDYSKWGAASDYIMNNNEDNLLKTILSASVDDLPDELKSCLLYTAGFPENRVIDAHQLVRLWMAEGFLTQQHGLETEQLGQCYLKELIYRGLLQLVGKTSAHGGLVEWVSIHDQLHRLLRYEAQRTGSMDVHYGGRIPAPENTRRLALHNYNDKFYALSNCLDKLRTVVSFSDNYTDYPQGSKNADQTSREELPLNMHNLLRGSPHLRVINLEGIDVGSELPEEIGAMVHLQYLGVRCRSLKTVPRSVGNLGKLQTIDVRGTEVKDLPGDLWKILTLRHVLGNGLAFPRSTGDLKLLQTLESVNIERVADYSSSGSASKAGKQVGISLVRRLHVAGLNTSQLRALEIVLRDLTSLESLSLSGTDIPIDIFARAAAAGRGRIFSCLEHVVALELNGKLVSHTGSSSSYHDLNFTGLEGCLLNLTHLVLRSTKIAQDFIDVIAKLPVLADLTMLVDSYDEERVVFCGQGFKSITMLQICGVSKLKKIMVPHPHSTRSNKPIVPKLIDMGDDVKIKFHKDCDFCKARDQPEVGQQAAAAGDNQMNGSQDGRPNHRITRSPDINGRADDSTPEPPHAEQEATTVRGQDSAQPTGNHVNHEQATTEEAGRPKRAPKPNSRVAGEEWTQ